MASKPKVSSSESERADSTLDDLSIDELLAAAEPDAGSQESVDSNLEDTGTFLPGDILMSPEEMFSKQELDEDS